MTRYFTATNFNDLKRILTAVEKPRVTSAIFRAVVEDDRDNIRFFDRVFREHGKVFINANSGIFSIHTNPKYDEVIDIVGRYKL